MKLAKFLFVLMMVINAPLLWAQDKSNAPAIDELIIKSGLQQQVEQFPDLVKAGADQSLNQNSKLTLEQKTGLETAIVQAFDPTLMLKTIKENVASGLTQDDINAILVWLNSSLGQKITLLEEQSSTEEGYKKMQEFAQGLANNPPDPKRVAVIGRLDVAAHLTENDVKMRMDMALAMAESMATAFGQKDFSKEALVSALEQKRPQIESSAKQNVIIGGLFTYQNLTDDELQQYINFYTSKEGQKYTNVTSEGLSQSIHDASERSGKALGQYAKQEVAKAADTTK